MKTHGQDFLETLAGLPSDTFESRFSRLALKLNLGSVLDRNELTLLYEAAFCASLCNHALNDVDAGRHEIQLERTQIVPGTLEPAEKATQRRLAANPFYLKQLGQTGVAPQKRYVGQFLSAAEDPGNKTQTYILGGVTVGALALGQRPA